MDSITLNPCKYKDIFGKPNEGAHSTRIAGLAAVDVVGTVAIAGVISAIWDQSFLVILVILLLLAILVHKLFCVDTQLNRWLGISD